MKKRDKKTIAEHILTLLCTTGFIIIAWLCFECYQAYQADQIKFQEIEQEKTNVNVVMQQIYMYKQRGYYIAYSIDPETTPVTQYSLRADDENKILFIEQGEN